ncbi:MAG TPA: glycoside hydrolase family 27 protein [Polyangia bacterium]|nr:glycoside hydrolase family 27 protein [Polyangia bacterium]
MKTKTKTRLPRHLLVCTLGAALAQAVSGCGTSDVSTGAGGAPGSGSGGQTAAGGASSSGGSNPGSGGQRASGGTLGTGGSDPGAGGSAGGGTGSGGAPPATGGAPGHAGTGGAATGGAGGAPASTGGVTGSGNAAGAGPLADKPFMGWSSWSSTTGNVTAAIVQAAADTVASKLSPYGYRYVNIDDGWYNGFDANGRWKPDTRKFPDGISGVASYVHGKGLKLGIYLTPGVNDTVVSANALIEGTSYHVKDIVTSAAGNTDKKSGATARKIDFTKPGAVEYVQGYANLLASWGVDFIKMDFVGPGGGGGSADNREDIKQWRLALDKSGRQIWLELSNMLDISAATTWKAYSNGWRVANDVECYCTTLTNWAHVIRVINAVAPWVSYAGPGGWNDLDSLEIGNGSSDGISADERQTVFSFWSISAAPLYLGASLSNLDAADLAILTNSEVIAVDQAGVPAKLVSTGGNQQVWYAKRPDGTFAVGLFNFDSGSAQVTARWSDLGAPSSVAVRDAVSHTDLGRMSTSFGAMLPGHGSRLLVLTP